MVFAARGILTGQASHEAGPSHGPLSQRKQSSDRQGSVKLTMTLLVRNEADILEDNIRFHHAIGVDSFIVMDNLSEDDTPAILARLAREFDIELLRQKEDDYNQWQWVTEMARRAARDHGADWVINNDADEFWLPEAGDLKQLLASLPDSTSSLRVMRHNAVVGCAGGAPLEGHSHPRHSDIFEVRSRNQLGHLLPGKVLHRASEVVTVAQGNHGVSDLPGQEEAAGARLRILHFPYRSLINYKAKIRLGGAAYGRNTDLPTGVGATWRDHYRGLDTGVVDRFWTELAQTPEEQVIGRYAGHLFHDNRLAAVLNGDVGQAEAASQAAPPQRERAHAGGGAEVLAQARSQLLGSTATMVRDFSAGQAHFIDRVGRNLRWQRPMYFNLRFAINSAEAHEARLRALITGKGPTALAADFVGLRDVFSLFPRNDHMRPFLAALLQASQSTAVQRLRADCAGRRVILHTSCHPRLAATQETHRSFAPLEADGDRRWHHVFLLGTTEVRSEEETPLTFFYDGQILQVPVPDNYESLHRKLFYAYMLFDLLTEPELVVKIDDNILLEDAAGFVAMVDRAAGAGLPCAGRRVGGERHDGQWHGWHIGKCADPLIEARGYQYPLPRAYAAGGYGYLLNREGLAACSYMYLSMKAFFAMQAVGLEDACVGHALYAKGLELLDVSGPDHLLALPGLTTKEYQRRQMGWSQQVTL